MRTTDLTKIVSIVFGIQSTLAISNAWSVETSAPHFSWKCDAATWIGQPSLRNGVFHSTRATHCRVICDDSASSALDIKQVFSRLKSNFEHTKHLEIRAILNAGSTRDLASLEYSATDRIPDGNSNLVVDEKVQLTSDFKTSIEYKSTSKNIKGDGISSYLKKLDYQFEFTKGKNNNSFEVTLINSIEVERPWYVLAEIFESVAKKKAISKFDSSTDEFLNWLLNT